MSKPLFSPEGGFSIGSVTTELTDHDRPRSLVHDESDRRLFIKVWYPCVEQNAEQSCERLWEQLLLESKLPLPMRWLSRWMARYQSATYTNARANPHSWNGNVVLYNHGLIGFASENTTLAEHLSSRGNIFIAVQHLDQLQEYRALESEVSKDDRERNKHLVQQLQRASGEERLKAAVQFYERASNTNAMVAERTVDSQFVIDHLDSLLANIPGLSSSPKQNIAITAIGLSLGGAVSMELAKNDQRVRRVVNIDGGVFGKSRELPLSVPCSMIYSEPNKEINKLALQSSTPQIESTTVDGSKHINFHDIALVFPRMLKALGALGTADSISVIRDRNDLIDSFIKATTARP